MKIFFLRILSPCGFGWPVNFSPKRNCVPFSPSRTDVKSFYNLDSLKVNWLVARRGLTKLTWFDFFWRISDRQSTFLTTARAVKDLQQFITVTINALQHFQCGNGFFASFFEDANALRCYSCIPVLQSGEDCSQPRSDQMQSCDALQDICRVTAVSLPGTNGVRSMSA